MLTICASNVGLEFFEDLPLVIFENIFCHYAPITKQKAIPKDRPLIHFTRLSCGKYLIAISTIGSSHKQLAWRTDTIRMRAWARTFVGIHRRTFSAKLGNQLEKVGDTSAGCLLWRHFA